VRPRVVVCRARRRGLRCRGALRGGGVVMIM